MKGKLAFGIISVLFWSLISCNPKEQPIGLWDDNIKLSTKEVTIGSKATSLVITTKGTWWWLNNIKLNEKSYEIDKINTSKEFIIEETAFKIERKNATEIHIFMSENKTDSKRILTVSLQAGNYFDWFKVIQSKN